MPIFEFYLHRQGAIWRRPLFWRGCLVLVFGLCGIVACKGDASDRYAYHVARAWGIFGANQRITVTAAPGLVEGCDNSEDILSSCVRAGSPFPVVRVSNGDIESSEATLHISNVDDDIIWDVYLEPLLQDEPQDQRCARDALGPPPASSTRFAEESGKNLLAHLAPCSSLVFVGKPAVGHASTPYRVAVLGGLTMREGELRLFLQRLAQRSPAIDFVYLVGDVVIRNSEDSLATLEELMEAVDLPWTMVMSPDRLNRGYARLVDHVGSLDYQTRIHGMPLIVSDTASARVTDPQRKALKRLRSCDDGTCPPSIAMMSIAPISLHTFEVGIFRSQILAQEFLGTLRDAGLTVLVSAVGKGASKTYFSGIELFDVGRSQSGDRFLELVFVPRVDGTQLCDRWLAIEKDSRWTVSQPRMECADQTECRKGICLPRCEQNADCELGRACDSEGYCRAPCADGSCEDGVCGHDDFCEEGPRTYTREHTL